MWVKRTPDNIPYINAVDMTANGITVDEDLILRTAFDECGCLLILDLFDESEIDNLKNHFDHKFSHKTAAQLENDHHTLGDGRYLITMSLEPPFDNPSLYAHPHLMYVMHSLFLGEEFLIDNFSAVQSLPGSNAQRIHRDHDPLFMKNLPLTELLPCYAIGVVIPLVDINLQCGSTVLYPGTHKNIGPTGPKPPGVPAYPQLKRGSVYLWDYRLAHNGMANNADYARPILTFLYARSWFSDVKNLKKEGPIYLSMEQYKKIPELFKPLFDRLRWQIKD